MMRFKSKRRQDSREFNKREFCNTGDVVFFLGFFLGGKGAFLEKIWRRGDSGGGGG